MPETDAGHTLLYLVYGQDQKYQHELSYSVLSAFREAKGDPSNLRVLLFSDEENRRPDLPVTPYVMNAEERECWTLGGSYHHAMKIFALRKALEVAGGKVCFVDTDTAFRADPHQLFNRITDATPVMHAAEGTLGDLHSWSSFLGKAAELGLADIVHPAAPMYNSGLIGVTPTMSDTLEQACDLMRSLHEVEPVFNIEQFVLGTCLARTGDIRLADDLVDHYWGYRRHIYHGKIPAALAALNGQFSTAAACALPVITHPKKPVLARLRAKAHGALHRADASYRFGYLAYLASGSAASAEEQQIWARIALDMMERSEAVALARRSFHRFAPDAIDSSGLPAELRSQWQSFWASAR